MDSTFWILCFAGGCLGYTARDWRELGFALIGEVLGILSVIARSN